MTTRLRTPLRWLSAHPLVLILLVAPYFGEGLSGSTPPLDLVLPWNLAFMAALYGCGALVCREVAHRFGLGIVGLALLGAAYGVWEEALVDRYWFYPSFWASSGIGDYSVVDHTNVLLAVHLTAFHTAISICCSVLVVEWLSPGHRDRPWVGRVGLGAAAVVLASTVVIYGELDRHPPLPLLAAAGGLLGCLVVAALVVGRARQRAVPDVAPGDRSGRRGLGLIAFVAVLGHWVATYGIAQTDVPWPLGVVIAVAPILLGGALVRRWASTGPYGADGVRVVCGLVAFFVLLDVVVGLGGRYDLVVGALLTAYGLHRLRVRYVLGPAHDLARATPGTPPAL